MAQALFFLFYLAGVMLLAIIPIFIIMKVFEFGVNRGKKVKDRF